MHSLYRLDLLEVGLIMKSILIQNLSKSFPRKGEPRLISIKDKIEDLKLNIETQKYELLTANQYLKHMELVVSILGNYSKFIDSEQGQDWR